MAQQHDMGEVHHGLALELNENDPWTMISTALAAAFCGDHQRARVRADRALSLSRSASNSLGLSNPGSLLGRRLSGCLGGSATGWCTFTFSRLESRRIVPSRFQGPSDGRVSEIFAKPCRKDGSAVTRPPESVGKWFLHCFPIKDKGDWERLRDAVEGAGIPSPGSAPTFGRVRPNLHYIELIE